MKKNQTKNVELYLTLAASVVRGLIRMNEAIISKNTFEILALKAFGGPKPLKQITVGNCELTLAEFASFKYVSDISILTYATTLIDTFLTDVTKFLIMLYPKTIGDDTIVKFDEILAHPSKSAIVNEKLSKKIRSISFRSLNERLDYLKNTFGLKIHFDKKTTDSLNCYSDLRNLVVHDQGFYGLQFNEQMELTLIQRACPFHPTPVSHEDRVKAISLYRIIMKKIHVAICSQVLKCENDERASAIAKSLLESAPESPLV